jgi:hypothetical protein
LYLSIPWFGVLSYPITSQSPSTRDVAATATRTDTESVTAVSFPRTENSAEIPFGGDAFESETRDNATFAHVQINGFQLFCTKSPEECKVEVRDWMSSILRGDMIRDNATMATTATATATAHVSKQRGPTFTNDPCFSLHAPSSCFVTTYPTTNFATWPAVVNTTWVKPYPTVVATNDLPLAAGSLDSCTRYTQWFDSSRKKKVMPNSCGTVAWVYGSKSTCACVKRVTALILLIYLLTCAQKQNSNDKRAHQLESVAHTRR